MNIRGNEHRIARFQRLLKLDNQSLDLAREALIAARTAVRLIEEEIGQMIQERQEEISRPAMNDPVQQIQTRTWLDWAAGQIESRRKQQAELEKNMKSCEAEFQRIQVKVKGWEKLIENSRRRIVARQGQIEQLQADEHATRVFADPGERQTPQPHVRSWASKTGNVTRNTSS